MLMKDADESMMSERDFFEEANKAKLRRIADDESDDIMSPEEFFMETDDEDISESDGPEDVITVGDFIDLLKKNCKLDDKIEFRSKKASQLLHDVASNGGITVIQLSDSDRMRESKDLSKWQPVDSVDPKAKGRLTGWKCGPSSKDLVDLLYPERKYIDGIPMLRNKYVKAGSMSGEICIALPSYFDAIKHNDKEAIVLLTALKIPLNLTLGLDPDGDYSFDYDIC